MKSAATAAEGRRKGKAEREKERKSAWKAARSAADGATKLLKILSSTSSNLICPC
ncbi:hypothetical protein WN55_09999 [Dufourea novaeangliae]|uniref:Uncharacterized protein n=1 Tax=Dufourea novaeangliae TaxID=178035 RepID=A0A154PA75_DUFNO|nr:hypothetical protein WN55_09999 [Dufourea novaeangliae]